LEIENKTREFYLNQGFTNLTTIQTKSLPVICRRIDSILIAPTGSGKTEAAILPVLTMIRELNSEKSGGIKALYITPLRSLNNDVFRRIEKYASDQGLRLEIRHGDTSAAKKKKIQRTAGPDSYRDRGGFPEQSPPGGFRGGFFSIKALPAVRQGFNDRFQCKM